MAGQIRAQSVGGPVPSVPAGAQEPDGGAGASGSKRWSDEELEAFRAALTAEVQRLRQELRAGQSDLSEVTGSEDGAGDDQADVGARTLEREQEMSVTENVRELLGQSLRALQRLDAGTYGLCESCGGPIPVGRLRAFPRATLCVPCKQAEERR